MTTSNDIHQSIIDANDIEEIHEDEISIGDVFLSLFKHPKQIITRWNWKSAMMGAMVRAFFYLFVYKAFKENWVVAFTAMIVEFGFRFFTSGISGALVQSFRRATPAWIATSIITVSLPAFSHTIEYFTHYMQEAYLSDLFAASENKGRQKAFAISVLFSLLSAMFNIFIMRNGVLLVGAGEETNSFSKDLKKIPQLLLQFVTYLPIEMINLIKARNVLPVIGIFLSFGLTVGSVLGFFRGKWSWAWTTAVGAWSLLFVWTIVVAVVLAFSQNPRKT